MSHGSYIQVVTDKAGITWEIVPTLILPLLKQHLTDVKGSNWSFLACISDNRYRVFPVQHLAEETPADLITRVGSDIRDATYFYMGSIPSHIHTFLLPLT